jgi:hypothetical protein
MLVTPGVRLPALNYLIARMPKDKTPEGRSAIDGLSYTICRLCRTYT